MKPIYSITVWRVKAVGELDRVIAHRLAKRERHNWLGRLLITVMIRLGLADAYWNSQLRKNGVFERRFDRPYVDGSGS